MPPRDPDEDEEDQDEDEEDEDRADEPPAVREPDEDWGQSPIKVLNLLEVVCGHLVVVDKGFRHNMMSLTIAL
jgi:hypothetical protein